MAYRQLSTTSPATLLQRVGNIETDLGLGEAAGLFGTHFYAGGICPNTLVTYGADTAGIATQIWVCELQIPKNALITGLAYLLGSVGGTDLVIAILYDSNGNVLANSALAGTTAGTASTFQRLAFVTPYPAAPGLYYVGISTNGTTAKIQTQQGGNHNAGAITGQTFGTLAAITPPTTFTGSKAPYVMSY